MTTSSNDASFDESLDQPDLVKLVEEKKFERSRPDTVAVSSIDLLKTITARLRETNQALRAANEHLRSINTSIANEATLPFI